MGRHTMILGYCRVSTVEQKRGTSMDEQERVIKGIALLHGVDPFDTIIFADPGISGSIHVSNRPAGKDMMMTAKKGDIIVASKLDRLFRSSKDALWTIDELTDKGVKVILADMGSEPVSESATGKLFFSLMSGFATFERDRLNERCHDGRKAKKAAGGCVGQVPYGMKKVGMGRGSRLIPDEYEQQVVEEVRKAVHYFPNHRALNTAYKDSNDLNAYVMRRVREKNFKTRAGTPFLPIQVNRLIGRVQSGEAVAA